MITRSQAAAAALRASRHPQADETFRLGLSSVFRQWTALNLAVTHQWGGPSSSLKADNLLEEIMRTFQGPEKVYKDDISLILEDVLETDFNTMCEDGSPDELGDLLVTMWRQCAEGDFTMVHQIREKESRSISQFHQSKGLDGGDEIDSDDENDGIDITEAAEITDPLLLSRTSEFATASESSTIANTVTTLSASESMETETEIIEPAKDPDGWETATRRRSRKKK